MVLGDQNNEQKPHSKEGSSGGKSEGKDSAFSKAMACTSALWWGKDLREGQGDWIQEWQKDANEKKIGEI